MKHNLTGAELNKKKFKQKTIFSPMSNAVNVNDVGIKNNLNTQ